MLSGDKEAMLDIIDDYIDHLEKSKHKSLLARIYGIFTIKTKLFNQMDLMIMQNSSKMIDSKRKRFEFDLKGSMIGRVVKYSSKTMMILKRIMMME